MRSGKISRRNCFQFLFILSVLVPLNRTCLSWAANTQFLPSIMVVFANKNILYFFFKHPDLQISSERLSKRGVNGTDPLGK